MFNNLCLLHRIIIVALLPMLVVLWLASEKLSSLYNKVQALEEIVAYIEYAQDAAELNRALQDERTYATVYFETKRKMFAPEYLAAQQKSNEAIQQILTGLSTSPLQKTQKSFLKKTLEQSENGSVLDAVRLNVEQGKRKFNDKSWTLPKYDDISHKLLSSIREVVNESSEFEGLNKISNAFFFNLKSREWSARTSNLAVGEITRGNLSAWKMKEISAFEARRKTYLEQFYQYASPQQKKLVDNTSETMVELSKIYMGMHKRINQKLPYNSNEWHEKSEKVLAIYDHAAAQLSQQFIAKVNMLETEAIDKLISSFIALFIVVTVVIALSVLITRSVINPLTKLISALSESAARKDLNTHVDNFGRNELSDVGDAFNLLMKSMGETLKNVQQAANRLGESTKVVVSSNHSLRELAVRQNTSTDSVSAAVEEMSHSIRDVASNAQLSSDTVRKAYDTSVSNAEHAEHAAQMMNELIQELHSTNSVVATLNHEANKIGGVLNVIQEISEQTNLLALNAAIEAARAGEHGRGFAVVADEVRGLAGRTQESTKIIRKQIDSLQAGAVSASESMTLLEGRGTESVKLVQDSAQEFESLKVELDDIASMAEQIATAAEQQTAVAHEITERIHLVKEDSELMSEQTVGTEHEAGNLDVISEQLQGFVAEFHYS